MAPRLQIGRRVSEVFFKPLGNALWQCHCGIKRKRSGTSYANLVSHVKDHHDDFEEILAADPDEQQRRIDLFFNNNRSKKLHGWFNLIIDSLLPFSCVEKDSFPESVKFKSMSVSTFMSVLPRLAKVVEAKIADILPEKFALVFDGWTCGSTHYLSIYASFPADNCDGYSLRLLTFSPMCDEDKLDADTHLEFIVYILGLYNKGLSNVACLIGDNTNTNPSIATKAKLPFIGCASHRFNLAAKDIMSADEQLVLSVNELMLKLKNLTLAAKLRKLTALTSRTRNVTRWSSTFDMLKRYQEIRNFLPDIDSENLDDVLLSSAENRRVDALMEELKNLESVTKRLQKEGTTLSNIRDLFDSVIEDYPETEFRLASNAQIVNQPLFESAVVKIQRGEERSMSREERSAVKKLEVTTTIAEPAVDENVSYADRALNRRSTGAASITQKYIDTRFLQPTSNVCERVFSKAGHALNPRRRATLPSNSESQVFLHANMDLWGPRDFTNLPIIEEDDSE